MKFPTTILSTALFVCGACFGATEGSSQSLRRAHQPKNAEEGNDFIPRILPGRKGSQEANDNAAEDAVDPQDQHLLRALQDHEDTTTMGSYIIEFDDRVKDIQGAVDIIANWLERRPGHVYKQLVHGFSIDNVPSSMVSKIESIDGVLSVELDEEVTLDGELRQLEDKARFQDEQYIPWGITRVNGGRTYNGTNVAFVLDSGVDLDHPDLNVHPTLCFSAYDGVSCDDDNGHGTHVAGTIAAKDNGIGVVGVAAGATIVPVKVVQHNGRGTMGTLLRGIEWVAEQGKEGDVVNISLGGSKSTTVDRAIRIASKKGIRFALSAGNGSRLATETSPARTNGRYIYTIGATTKDDQLAYFSNYGKPPVDWVMPGINILSTHKDGGYSTMQGTSMAAPHAAGALLFPKRKAKRKIAPDKAGNRYKLVQVKS